MRSETPDAPPTLAAKEVTETPPTKTCPLNADGRIKEVGIGRQVPRRIEGIARGSAYGGGFDMSMAVSRAGGAAESRLRKAGQSLEVDERKLARKKNGTACQGLEKRSAANSADYKKLSLGCGSIWKGGKNNLFAGLAEVSPESGGAVGECRREDVTLTRIEYDEDKLLTVPAAKGDLDIMIMAYGVGCCDGDNEIGSMLAIRVNLNLLHLKRRKIPLKEAHIPRSDGVPLLAGDCVSPNDVNSGSFRRLEMLRTNGWQFEVGKVVVTAI
ncbi:hypothetical protein Tco_0615805 [Tanacetum coccineum]